MGKGLEHPTRHKLEEHSVQQVRLYNSCNNRRRYRQVKQHRGNGLFETTWESIQWHLHGLPVGTVFCGVATKWDFEYLSDWQWETGR